MDPIFESIFEKFREAFPAGTSENHTMKLTTDELYKSFIRFYPGELPETDFFNRLVEAGYIYVPEERSGTINFYWLLRKSW